MDHLKCKKCRWCFESYTFARPCIYLWPLEFPLDVWDVLIGPMLLLALEVGQTLHVLLWGRLMKKRKHVWTPCPFALQLLNSFLVSVVSSNNTIKFHRVGVHRFGQNMQTSTIHLEFLEITTLKTIKGLSKDNTMYATISLNLDKTASLVKILWMSSTNLAAINCIRVTKNCQKTHLTWAKAVIYEISMSIHWRRVEVFILRFPSRLSLP